MNCDSDIAKLREKVFEQDNGHCFIERERFLASVHGSDSSSYDFHARTFAAMLDSVSTPVDEYDVIVGRVLEAPPPADAAECPDRTLFAKGHIIPDYARLLKYGYRGILEKVRENAKAIGTEEARQYAENAETVVGAVRRFASRYSEAAAAAGKTRAAEALSKVPYEPAYDLFSALQSIWLVHMIASCYMGARDYAFGYMDEYLYPYYLAQKESGTDDGEIIRMLAGFFIKPNEICGRHPHNYQKKPVLCQSAKQYVLLDGGRANDLSSLILEAAKVSRMAQPEFTVILTKDTSPDFREHTFSAMADLTDKLQVYNGDLLKSFLSGIGMPEYIAERPAFSACCTGDIYTHNCREEFYCPTVELFCRTLYGGGWHDKKEFLESFARSVTESCENYLDSSRDPGRGWARGVFTLDTLLLGTCNERCEYPPYGLEFRAKNLFLPGLATLGDSLLALEKTVFAGKTTAEAFINMLKADFKGYAPEHAALSSLPKFGNDDDEADAAAVEIANVMLDAVQRVRHAANEVILPSFYSLERDNVWAADIPATPDGRISGEPFSENQSPVYGADRHGVTALLNSLSKIPFYRTAAGGLNLSFSSSVSPGVLKALAETYFGKGGLHIGISVLDKETLRDAMVHPERYRSLTVRLYGFSEYFVSLPAWQQLAVLNRTAY